MKPERRQSPRIHSTVPLDLYDPRGRMVIGEGYFVNISEQGAMVRSRNTLASKKKIRLHLAADKESPLQLSGRVVWTQKKRPGFTYGIRFDPIPAPLAP
ncbi:MAG: PilZ domain-containing protein [Elusimicrobiota bacterium]|jgi:hypothetical protein